MQFGVVVLATSVAFLISNGSFYTLQAVILTYPGDSILHG